MSLGAARFATAHIRRLVLVSHRQVSDRADLERIGERIAREAPDLRVSVVRDRPYRLLRAR